MLHRPEDAIAVHVQLAAVRVGEPAERFFVSRLGEHQRSLAHHGVLTGSGLFASMTVRTPSSPQRDRPFRSRRRRCLNHRPARTGGGDGQRNDEMDPGAAMGRRPDRDGLVHRRARHARGLDRAQRDPRRPRRVARAARVDRQRLHAHLRGAADDRGGPRRPVRPPAHVRRRHGPVRRRVRRLRARARRRVADRRAGRPGRRRSGRHAARPHAARRGVRAPRAGAVVEGISWSWIFWLNVPLALVLIPLALTRLDESRGPETALDVPGLALVTGAGFGIVWGLVRGNAAGWGSLEVVATLALGALLAVAFVVCELRTREPMLPMSLFRVRPFSGGNAAFFFLWASTFGAIFFFAQFLQTSLGSTPLE